MAHLQPEGSVVVVLEAIVGGGASGDVKHGNPELVQRLVGLPQVSNQVPNAFVTT